MNGIQSNLIGSLYKSINEDSLDSVCGKDYIRTDDGDAVNQFITSKTSPQEFDAFCDSLESYEPEHGGFRTALGEAASKINLPLVRHLIDEQVIKQGKTHLLDLGSHPILVGSGENYMEESNFEIARLCIQAGAKVNLASRPLFDDECITPLDQAARSHKLSLVNMLIVNGGLMYAPRNYMQSNCIQKALNLLFNRVKYLIVLSPYFLLIVLSPYFLLSKMKLASLFSQ